MHFSLPKTVYFIQNHNIAKNSFYYLHFAFYPLFSIFRDHLYPKTIYLNQ